MSDGGLPWLGRRAKTYSHVKTKLHVATDNDVFFIAKLETKPAQPPVSFHVAVMTGEDCLGAQSSGAAVLAQP